MPNYKNLICPSCIKKNGALRGKWKVYITPDNMKLHCRVCGFRISVPMKCPVCEARVSMSGQMQDQVIVYVSQDFLVIG